MNNLAQQDDSVTIFLPAMWMFGYFVDPYWASGIGVIFVASRMVYRQAYIKDPKSRSAAFSVGFVMMSVLLVGAIIGAVVSFLH